MRNNLSLLCAQVIGAELLLHKRHTWSEILVKQSVILAQSKRELGIRCWLGRTTQTALPGVPDVVSAISPSKKDATHLKEADNAPHFVLSIESVSKRDWQKSGQLLSSSKFHPTPRELQRHFWEKIQAPANTFNSSPCSSVYSGKEIMLHVCGTGLQGDWNSIQSRPTTSAFSFVPVLSAVTCRGNLV